MSIFIYLIYPGHSDNKHFKSQGTLVRKCWTFFTAKLIKSFFASQGVQPRKNHDTILKRRLLIDLFWILSATSFKDNFFSEKSKNNCKKKNNKYCRVI